MHHTGPTPSGDRTASGIILSLGFWCCFAAAAVLFGAVSLSSRLMERHRLEQQFARRQGDLLTLQREVDHLEAVVRALEAEGRLTRSVALHELRQAPRGVAAIPVEERLRYDPREADVTPVDVDHADPWYLFILRALAESPERRWGWGLVSAGLLVFGFVLLHEQAGSRTVWFLVTQPLRYGLRRYQQRNPPSAPHTVD